MKKIALVLLLSLMAGISAFSQSASATYTAGDISTDINFISLPGASACPGSLTVVIPDGATVTGVDVSYSMTAQNEGWLSEQVSQLRCVSTGGTNEETLTFGSGEWTGDTYNYARTGLTIANGVSGGGNIEFQLHAGRYWGDGVCNTDFNKVDNNTWTVIVYYSLPGIPDPPTDPNPADAATDVSLSGNLTWNFGSGTSYYDLWFGPSGSMTMVIDNQAAGPAGSWNYTGSVTNETTYQWQVIERSSGGIPMNGPVWSFTTLSAPISTYPYCQNFSGAGFPDAWTEQLEGLITSSHWSMANSNNAGGTGYEARASFEPGQGTTEADNDRLVSPPFNTTGLTTITLSFRHMFEDYNAGTNDVWIKVQSSSDGVNWTDEWVNAGGIGNSIPAEMKYIYITSNLGATTWIAFTLSGVTFDIYYWYVDEVCISVPALHDARTIYLDNIPALTSPGTTIIPKATVQNYGTTSPETFDVTMSATDGYTSAVYGVNLDAGEYTQVTFADWAPAPGYHTVQVCTQLSGDLNTANNCISQDVKILDVPDRTVYACNSFPNTGTDPLGPTAFSLSSPGTLNSIANQTTLNFIAGATWVNGTWYGIVHTDNTLISIDMITGSRTVIGSLGVALNGLSFDITSGIMYGVDATALYTVSMTTGQATLVGANAGIDMVNLAINDAGEAYGIDLTNDVLGTISLTTGVFTSIGPIGFDANYAQDMEFDRESGELYVAAQDNVSGWLAWANTLTGSTAKIGDFEGGAEITGLAIPYCIGPDQWTGNISSDWTDPRNWTCGLVPDHGVTVFIPSSPAGGWYPAIPAGTTAECFDITIASGGNLQIMPGAILIVLNH